MKLGLCTFLKDLDAAAGLGYDYLVLSGSEVASLDEEAFTALAQKVDREKLNVTAFNAICPPKIDICGPAYSETLAGDYMRMLSARGARLGVKTFGIGAPRSRMLPEGFLRQNAWENGRDFISMSTDIANEYGIEISMEALAPSYCDFINTLEESRRIMENIHSDQGTIIIDFFHMEAAGAAPEEAAGYLPFARDIHISGIDNSTSRPGRPFLSEADRDRLNSIARVLKQGGYNRTVALEPDSVSAGFVEKACTSLQIMREVF